MNNIYSFTNGKLNGFCLTNHQDEIAISSYDMGEELERIVNNNKGELVQVRSLNIEQGDLDLKGLFEKNKAAFEFVQEKDKEIRWSSLMEVIELPFQSEIRPKLAKKMVWAYERNKRIELNEYEADNDMVVPFLQLSQLSGQVEKNNDVLNEVKHVAGIELAYHKKEQRLIVAIAVLDIISNRILETKLYEEEITLPYIQSLYSLKELKPALASFQSIGEKIDLILCGAPGIAHPKEVGLATAIGIATGLPSIGITTGRLVGYFDSKKLGNDIGSTQPLRWNSKNVGLAYRSQAQESPLFISIGHKVDLKDAKKWAKRFCYQSSTPAPLLQAKALFEEGRNLSFISHFSWFEEESPSDHSS